MGQIILQWKGCAMVAVPHKSRDRGLRMQMRVGTRRAANFSHAQVRVGVPLLGDAGLAHVVAQLHRPSSRAVG